MLLAALVAGCGGEPPTPLYADYLWRLGNAIDADAPELAAVVAPPLRYPRARERRRAVPAVRGGVLELFELARCDVAELIAERNSILGRHADAATHFANGGRVLRRLESCRQRLDAKREPELAARLDELVAQKRPALEAQAWNATFGAGAFAGWWSPSARGLTPEAVQQADPAASLRTLVRARNAAHAGEMDAAQAAFSDAYQGLERRPYGGAWIESAQVSLAALEAAAAMLAAVDTDRLCPQARPTPRARVLHTVFRQRYVARVQPYLAALSRGMEAIAQPLEALWPGKDAAVPAVAGFRHRTWHAGPEGLRARLTEATREHAEAWQRVLRACDLMPEAPG